MYDYVIVGAGSAGCVLAARLTEDPDVDVLLVEAGPPDTADNVHVPVAFSQLFRTQYDWDYSTALEPFADRRRIYLPRGKGLGGSSSINAMIYIRGNPLDYDEWRDAGCEGWGFDDLLPYFKRSEDNERGESELHGAGGPLAVSEGRHENPITDAFLEAAAAAGHPSNDDFNGEKQDGFGRYQVTQRDGKRCSASVAYLHPALARPNLTVETHTQVHRVLFEGGRAVGVEGERAGEPREFRAEREVILCGGAYNSPQLLMLSGVGPAEPLTLLQIPVVADRPEVGQQPPGPPGRRRRLRPRRAGLAARRDDRGEPGAVRDRGTRAAHLQRRRGGRLHPHRRRPARARHPVPRGARALRGRGPVAGLRARLRGGALHDQAGQPRRGRPALPRPDREAADPPQLLLRGLRHGGDGRRAARRDRDQPSRPRSAPYTTRPYYMPDSDSDEDIRAFIRRQTFTLYHPVGTCRMGSDDGAVVDTELRVRGVESLRVVDASVMPTVTRGNTNAPTIAIAERAADLIRGVEPAAPRGRRKPPLRIYPFFTSG